MKFSLEVVGPILVMFMLSAFSFMFGRAYQQDVEKGYYEELQIEKNRWKPTH